MRSIGFIIIGLILTFVIACERNNYSYSNEDYISIPDFNFTKTLVFEDSLSAYDIYKGIPTDLIPSDDYELLELSSTLFTDYAHKQRLVKIPPGTKLTRLSDGSIDFPDKTILTKTFYYYYDERDTSLGKRVIETRLLIKHNSKWNLATYIWNEEQTDAVLDLNGYDTNVNWISANGEAKSTLYHVPNDNECMTCHQSNSTITPIGPTLRNLNRYVIRNDKPVNQINHLQSKGLLSNFPGSEVSTIVDYKDVNASLERRARAYLDMNCAHCHNPSGWEKSNERRFDFRYELPFNQTGIPYKQEKIARALMNGKMPFIGTTMLDEEGIELMIAYLNNQK